MNGIGICQNIFETINILLKGHEFEDTYCKAGTFVRNRKMSFEMMILYLLNSSKKAIPINIADVREKLPQISFPDVSKQAVSKARQGICPEAFAEFFRISVTAFYNSCSALQTWNGYHVYAIDRSSLQIPQTKRNLFEFGGAINQTDHTSALADVSVCFDVLNDIVIDAIISSHSYGERKLAMKHLQQIECHRFRQNSLFIFDRGYPSYNMYRELQERNVFFLMRTSSKIHTSIPDNTIFPFRPKEHDKSLPIITLRKIHVPLKDGTIETLVTNILDPSVTSEMFKELYFLRWGIEGKYKEFKGRLEIEEFTGSHPTSIMQDFFITMFKSNMAAIIKMEADLEIKQKRKSKKNKYEYQANRSFIINRIQECIAKLAYALCDIRTSLESIVKNAVRNLSQIQPDRSFSRKKKNTKRKHYNNIKSCL